MLFYYQLAVRKYFSIFLKLGTLYLYDKYPYFVFTRKVDDLEIYQPAILKACGLPACDASHQNIADCIGLGSLPLARTSLKVKKFIVSSIVKFHFLGYNILINKFQFYLQAFLSSVTGEFKNVHVFSRAIGLLFFEQNKFDVS